MTELEALNQITWLIEKVSGKKKEISANTDLRKDNILDSLDMLIFFMELENSSGVRVPDTDKLIAENWYSVEKLCNELKNNNK